MKLPIAKQLKKRTQVEVAFLQDEIIDILYSISDDLVLHGGTAIWRCYSGKRFSEDLNFYSKSFPEVFPSFKDALESHGLNIPKIKDTGNVISSNITNNNSVVKVEVNYVAEIMGHQMKFEMADGSNIEILSLTPDQFINEKILAYSDRRYIRDLYDIYHLATSFSLTESTMLNLRNFIKNIQEPVDQNVLRTLVYSGLAPSIENMKLGILRCL